MWQKLVITSLAVAMALAAGSGSKSPLPDPTQAKRQLLKLEDQWLQGLQDPQAQEQILADDFVHALPLGLITKKEQLDFLRGQKQPADNLSRHFEDLRVRIYGTAGIVNGMVVATDKAGAVVKKTVFTDVFAYRDGGWQAVNAQENDYQPRPQ
ncbi:MAG TPA: nuclear transport factor 2 family protein [Candidatus Angelobacter sp.]|nr:nuclear transport factor 2 family protein [Candidatus Angelobacter sp.]